MEEFSFHARRGEKILFPKNDVSAEFIKKIIIVFFRPVLLHVHQRASYPCRKQTKATGTMTGGTAAVVSYKALKTRVTAMFLKDKKLYRFAHSIVIKNFPHLHLEGSRAAWAQGQQQPPRRLEARPTGSAPRAAIAHTFHVYHTHIFCYDEYVLKLINISMQDRMYRRGLTCESR